MLTCKSLKTLGRTCPIGVPFLLAAYAERKKPKTRPFYRAAKMSQYRLCQALSPNQRPAGDMAILLRVLTLTKG